MNLLPQLPSIKAKVILEDIASKSNCETLDPKGNFKVEGIFYVPTGGQIINDENLEKLRNNVLEKAKVLSETITDEQKAMDIYAEALQALIEGDAFYAGKKFREVESLVPQGNLASKASLMSSYSEYNRNAYSNAVFNLERHIRNYPADEKLIEVIG